VERDGRGDRLLIFSRFLFILLYSERVSTRGVQPCILRHCTRAPYQHTHARARARTNAHTNTASGGTGGAPLAPVSLLAEGKMCSKTYVYINFVVF
jgi:hypothetical protein